MTLEKDIITQKRVVRRRVLVKCINKLKKCLSDWTKVPKIVSAYVNNCIQYATINDLTPLMFLLNMLNHYGGKIPLDKHTEVVCVFEYLKTTFDGTLNLDPNFARTGGLEECLWIIPFDNINKPKKRFIDYNEWG